MHPYVREHLPQIIEICKRHRVKRLALFGSALDDSFDPARSDVDLLIDFDSTPPVDHFHRYFDLAIELEDTLGRPVDLVERHMLRNPYIKRSVLDSQLLLYDAA